MIWRTYERGFKDGQLQTVQNYERVVGILREELSDARRLADEQSSRADAAVDLLLGHLGTRAISLAGQQHEDKRAERNLETVKTLTAIPDFDEELPYDHPNARFKSHRDAALFNDDVAGAEG